MIRDGWRRIAAVSLTVTAVCAAPTAAAVVPPTVDDARLPPALPPDPPGPTEPTGVCATGADPLEADRTPQLASLDLAAAHRLSRGSGQTVAVIDTGVNPHRRLPRLIGGGDYVSTGDGTRDCDGHGTAVAGIVAAVPDDPADGFVGAAPEATVLAIRQSSALFRITEGTAGTGSGVGDVDTMAAAVRTAADLGATVITISSVACVAVADGLDDGALGAALAYAVDVRNAVVVSAAGNVGGQCDAQNPPAPAGAGGAPDWSAVEFVVSPAWYDDYVLTVGSVGTDGGPSAFSMSGPWVDVAAPGESVVSLSPDGERLADSVAGEPLAGTSYAAPVVAGVAALIRSRAPHLTARQVMQRIESTARRPAAGWDPAVGFGVVDVVAAVSADGTGPSPAPTARPGATQPEPPKDRVSHSVAFGGAALAAAVAGIAALTAGGLRRRDVPRD